MQKTDWHSGNLVFINANHIKVVKTKDSVYAGDVIYDSYYKRDNLVEILHILKSDHDFHKTNLVVADSLCKFYKIKISKKSVKRDLRDDVLAIIKLDLGHEPEDWSYDRVYVSKNNIYILGYAFSGPDFKNIKNSFNLSNIEVGSIRPRVFFDYSKKTEHFTVSLKSTMPQIKNTKESSAESVNVTLATNGLEGSSSVNFPKMEEVVKPKKARSFLHLDQEKSQLLSPWMVIIFVFVTIVIGISVFGVFSLRERVNYLAQESKPEVTSLATPTRIAPTSVNWDENTIDLSSYNILLLGESDEDSNLKNLENLLLSEGIISIESGVSELDRSTKTILTHKPGIPDAVVSRFLDIMSTEFETDLAGDLTDDYVYDLVVVVGDPKSID